MALFKCKMCGGALEINNNETVATCEYCGIQQTLPKLDDDRRANLYDRANHFRRNNEFDKAMGIYEQILNEDNTDAEAYWSLVLCRYGIEYVEDPSSHKRIPTVNRAQFTSIFDDDNYKSALQYADGYQRSIYEDEAKAINEIQKGILAISQKEEPFDVFICYKETDNNGRRTPDSVLANDLYHQLTQEGFKVFFARITLEDKLGSAYEPYIFAALNSANVMVVLGTKPEFFKAVWVRNEWSRYLALIKQGKKKMLIPAYKDMDPYDLPEEFSHLQAQDMSKLGFMQDLIRGIKKVVGESAPAPAVVKEKVIIGPGNVEPLLKRAFMFLEDGDWTGANEYCEKVLDMDPENAQAYLGKLMAELQVSRQEDLRYYEENFTHLKNFQKAVRFADELLKKNLNECMNQDDSILIKFFETKKFEYSALPQAMRQEYDPLLLEWWQTRKIENEMMAVQNEIFTLNAKCYEKIQLKNAMPKMDAMIKNYNEKLNFNQNEISKINEERINSGFLKRIKLSNQIDNLERDVLFLQAKVKKILAEKQKFEDTSAGYSDLEQISKELLEKEKQIQKFPIGRRSHVIMSDMHNSQAWKEVKRLAHVVEKKYPDKSSLISKLYNSLTAQPPECSMEIWEPTKVNAETITFGIYSQDSNISNESKAIEWIVLEVREQKALLISRYALECKAYNTTGGSATWENCTLRNWLNNEFFDAAFSDKEKAMIITAAISLNDYGAKVTYDRVFLLSDAEVEKYFYSQAGRMCEYDVCKDPKYCKNGTHWWLRFYGAGQTTMVSQYGNFFEDVFDSRSGYGVRPAMWIDLNA